MKRRVRVSDGVDPTEATSLRLSSGTWTNSIVIGIALIIGGLIAIGAAWGGVAGTPIVPKQVAFIVSGGLGGLALVIAGGVIITVQVSRYLGARELQKLDTSITKAVELLELVDRGSSRPSD